MTVGEFHVTFWPIKGSTRFRADHEGEVLVESCVEPLVAGARALAELGVDVNDKIVTIFGPANMRSLSMSIKGAIAMGERDA